MTLLRLRLAVLILGLLVAMQLSADSTSFSVQEKAWLEAHNKLMVGITEHGPPILFYGEARQPMGVVADYLRFIADKLGVEFELVRFDSERALDEALRQGVIDLIGAGFWSDRRAAIANFTRPYLSISAALYRRPGDGAVMLEELAGRRVAVVKGSVWHQLLMTRYPKIRPVVAGNTLAAMQKVEHGSADAYLGDTATASYQLTHNSGLSLSEVERLDLALDIALASRRSEPLLNSLLQKGLDRMTEEDHQEILQRWGDLDQADLSSSGSLRWSFWVFVGVAWLVVWILGFRYLVRRKVSRRTRSMKRSLNRRRKVETELKEEREQLKLKTEQINQQMTTLRNHIEHVGKAVGYGLWEWDARRELFRWDKRMYELFDIESGRFAGTLQEVLMRLHEADRERLINAFSGVTETGDCYQLNYRVVRKNGQVRTLTEHCQIIRNENGEITGRLGVVWDITDLLGGRSVESSQVKTVAGDKPARNQGASYNGL